MTAMIASSVKVGFRPSSAQARSYSSEVIPSSRASARVTSGSLAIALPFLRPSALQPVAPRLLPGVHDRIEDPPPLGVPQDLLRAAVGVRHHPQDVAAL